MTITNEFYAAQNHGHFKYFALGDFALEQGGKIPDCQLAYTTLGTLNARKDNVILFAHMFSQNQRVRVEWHLLKLCRVSMETDIFSGDFARYGQ